MKKRLNQFKNSLKLDIQNTIMGKEITDVELHKEELQSYFNGVGYERWAAIYGEHEVSAIRKTVRDGHALMMSQAENWLISHNLPKDARILDAGCGTGLFSIELAKKGFNIISVDIAEQMVEKAKIEAEKARVLDRIEFGVSDLESIQGSYDAIVCFDVLIHYPPKGFKTMCSKLASMSNGPFIFTYAPYNSFLAFKMWIGEFFPKNDRRMNLQMMKEPFVEESLALGGKKVIKHEKIHHGFYHTALVEAVPQ